VEKDPAEPSEAVAYLLELQTRVFALREWMCVIVHGALHGASSRQASTAPLPPQRRAPGNLMMVSRRSEYLMGKKGCWSVLMKLLKCLDCCFAVC
jgi:hypothetical protein